MDKAEKEVKYQTVINPDFNAIDIIRDYIKLVKKLWITIIVLLTMISSIFLGVMYFINNYEVVTTVETVEAGGDFQQYKDNAVHNEGVD